MDVYCLNCKEPWDTYHLRQDAIWDCVRPPLSTRKGAHVSEEYAERFGRDPKLTSYARKAFRQAGWAFGSSVYIVRHCPSCRDNKCGDAELSDMLFALLGPEEEHDGFLFEYRDLEKLEKLTD